MRNSIADVEGAKRAARDRAIARSDFCTHGRIALVILATTLLIVVWELGGLGAWVVLRSGLLRAPVGDDGARQLLVVGTQSSGTTSLTDALKRLGLEVAHENSNAAITSCRDGTISWFHGVRFFPHQLSEASIAELCTGEVKRTGFHPRMFRSPRGCTGELLGSWGPCLASQCRDVLLENWGCVLGGDGRAPCETPFAVSLLQVRHPLRVIESLGVKFCTAADAPLNPVLGRLLAALWPDYREQLEAGPCVAALGWYWALYHEALLPALDAGLLGWYRLEGSSPCEVARRAGFDRASVHPPAAAAFARACEGSASSQAARRSNRRNRGQLRVDASALDVLDAELGKRVRSLAMVRFGYDTYDQPQAVEPDVTGNATAAADGGAGRASVRESPRRTLQRRASPGSNDWPGA
jgi:hypothetical protein